ncbi:GTP-binding protein rhb1 [Termitomyces sp. J132]|nr:hypothetical protein C0989_000079 [Termitomyces sp. Mn162]KAH0587516.1 hypothetical protein H2248_006298 [Termitomyces sp. 'cryptogamus']KNZ79843.1 GTP-binding protein rhb1 [Termitomyces sp. J132]
MPSSGPMKRRKIAVLGARSVGKSSMVVQFTEGHFVESYYPTIESVFTKTVGYNGTDYDCEIIDTAGQDEFSLLGPKHTIGIHGFVLVYSVTSRRSFDMIQVIYDKIIDFCGLMDIPCVIVGAKMDLQNSRQVEKTEGQRLADSKRAAYTEASAKKNTNIALVFELCLAEIEKQSPTNSQQPADEKRPCMIM